MSTLDAGAHWLPWALAVGVLLASLRLLLQARGNPGRVRRWRVGALVLGQSVAALLLFLLLRSSDPAAPVHTLHVMTAQATTGPLPAPGPGERRVRLPEAPTHAGVAPMPDLATALRQFLAVRVLHVSGDGLEARDRPAAVGRRIVFTPAPPAVGITDWWAPQRLREGEPLHVVGTAHAPAGTRITLLDPAGARVDVETLQADGGFTLRANPRSAGLAEYRLQLSGSGGKPLDASDLQVRIEPPATTRILLLAGGPDPDLKYLRRWAADHGARLQASIDLGGGMRAGDSPFALDARTLGQADLLILDDRSWNALDRRRRETVLAAVDAGMGLLLRASMPLAQAEALGFRIRVASLPATYRIPVSPGVDAPPVMERPQLRIDNPGGVVLWRDDRGLALASWRARGRGRIGAWLPGDTFRLALSGHGALHARQWSSVLNVLMRPRAPAPSPMPLRIHAGQRIVLCALAHAPRVLAPGIRPPQPLVVDPRTGARRCAAYWPTRAGWHLLSDSDGERPFLVRDADEDRVLRAAQTRRATAALASQSIDPRASHTSDAPNALPRWLLFLAWLAVMGTLWWFERSGLGRTDRATAG